MDMQEAIQLTVNGEARQVQAGCSVAGLLEALRLDHRKVAIERNEAIVPKSGYEAVTLAAADRIEIVHFIGGG